MKKENEILTPSVPVSSTSPAVSSSLLGSVEILAYLQKAGLPPTRENYLAIAYPDGIPEMWTAELEAELPLELQDLYIKPPKSGQELSAAQ